MAIIGGILEFSDNAMWSVCWPQQIHSSTMRKGPHSPYFETIHTTWKTSSVVADAKQQWGNHKHKMHQQSTCDWLGAQMISYDEEEVGSTRPTSAMHVYIYIYRQHHITYKACPSADAANSWFHIIPRCRPRWKLATNIPLSRKKKHEPNPFPSKRTTGFWLNVIKIQITMYI